MASAFGHVVLREGGLLAAPGIPDAADRLVRAPLSPIQSAHEAGKISAKDGMPDVRSLRIPMRYLANLPTAGDEVPVASALERMLAMRSYMRAKSVEGRI